MADAIDRADDGVAALNHAVDPHQRVLLAAVVMDEFGAHTGGNPTKIINRAAAPSDIENAARDTGLNRLVADFGTGTDWRISRAHPLLPAQVRELAREVGNGALGGTGAFAG